MSKILVLSTVDYHYDGHGWSIAEKLKTQGHDVCFICLEKSMPNTENFFFDKYSKKGIQNIIRILYNNIDGIFLREVMKADSLYSFQTAGINGISAKRILKRCPFTPEVIYVTWTARFLTPKTIRDLYDKTRAQINFVMVDEAILSACHFPGNCRGFESGCKNCHGVKRFKSFPRRLVRMKEKYWTDMPATISGSKYDIELCGKVSFLRHMNMKGVVAVPDTSPFYTKQESRDYLGISKEDFVIFAGANNIMEKRKGFPVLIKAVNRLCGMIKGEKHVTLLIIGNLKGEFPYKVDESVSLIVRKLLPKKDFFKAYFACDVYASPTLADSGPMMVNYAIASGRPVVSFPVGCAMDLVVNGKTGYMAKYSDPDDFANGLLTFYNMSSTDLALYEDRCMAHIARFKDEVFF